MRSTLLLVALIWMAAGCEMPTVSKVDLTAADEHYAAQRYAEAKDLYQAALPKVSLKKDRGELHKLIGACELHLGDFEAALKSCTESLSHNPKDAVTLTNCGVCYRSMDNLQKAREYYLKAIAIDPTYAEAQSSMGTLLIIEEKYPQAIEHLQRAIQLNDSLAVTHGNLAYAQALAGDFDAAEKSLQKAIERKYANAPIIRERIDDLRRELGAGQGKAE